MWIFIFTLVSIVYILFEIILSNGYCPIQGLVTFQRPVVIPAVVIPGLVILGVVVIGSVVLGLVVPGSVGVTKNQ
jgi:hypothetical protein